MLPGVAGHAQMQHPPPRSATGVPNTLAGAFDRVARKFSGGPASPTDRALADRLAASEAKVASLEERLRQSEAKVAELEASKG